MFLWIANYRLNTVERPKAKNQTEEKDDIIKIIIPVASPLDALMSWEKRLKTKKGSGKRIFLRLRKIQEVIGDTVMNGGRCEDLTIQF